MGIFGECLIDDVIKNIGCNVRYFLALFTNIKANVTVHRRIGGLEIRLSVSNDKNCARKTALKIRYMEADLYNLVPAVGEINALRSNYSFAMIPCEKRESGKCDVEIENRKAEPKPDIRGDIARTYFYMDHAYPGRGIISKKNRKLFDAWDKQDPVDGWECERCRRIERIKGIRIRL